MAPVQFMLRINSALAVVSNASWQVSFQDLVATTLKITPTRVQVVAVVAGANPASTMLTARLGVDPVAPNSALSPTAAGSLLLQQVATANSSFAMAMTAAGLGSLDAAYSAPMQTAAVCNDGTHSFAYATGCPGGGSGGGGGGPAGGGSSASTIGIVAGIVSAGVVVALGGWWYHRSSTRKSTEMHSFWGDLQAMPATVSAAGPNSVGIEMGSNVLPTDAERSDA